MLKQIQRTGTAVWSPAPQYPMYLATGTVAGAVDINFTSGSVLELHEIDISDSGKDVRTRGIIESPTRFHKLAWSPLGSDGEHYPMGILVGGMDNGALSLYNPAHIVRGQPGLMASIEKHQGPVRGLDVNPFQPNLLASGGVNSEIFIWDFTSPMNPRIFAPGQQDAGQPSNISCVAWNRKVAHILASTTFEGTSAVWDLKIQKKVVMFRNQNAQPRCRAIAWNPENLTQVATVSENDMFPSVEIWDLRNATAPAREFRGHTKGILSASWCEKDPGLLLTCGKDNRTLCWNTVSGEVITELMPSENWNFDVQWCPRVPSLLSLCSFDGKVSVHSIMSSGGARGDTFIGPGAQLAVAPKWLRRPAGAVFGFGGKLVTFGNTHPPPGAPALRRVHIHRIVTEVELVQRAEVLERVKQPDELRQFCDAKIASTTADDERATWNVLRLLLEEDPRRALLIFLGFDPAVRAPPLATSETSTSPPSEAVGAQEFPLVSAAPPEPVVEAPPPPAPAGTEAVSGLFGGNGAGDDFASLVTRAEPEPTPRTNRKFSASLSKLSLNSPKSSRSGRTPNLGGGAALTIDARSDTVGARVTRALLVGDWRSAVDACISSGRLADALLLSSAASPEMFRETRAWYINQHTDPLLRIVGRIVEEDFASLVGNANLANWRETLAMVTSFARSEDFPALCVTLGERLQQEAHNASAAVVCYLCAADVDRALSVWVQRTRSQHDLQDLMEKVSVFRLAIQNTAGSSLLDDKLVEYASILASQGRLGSAMYYLDQMFNKDGTGAGAVLLDKVYFSEQVDVSGHPVPPFPFVAAEAKQYVPPAPVAESTYGGAYGGGNSYFQQQYPAAPAAAPWGVMDPSANQQFAVYPPVAAPAPAPAAPAYGGQFAGYPAAVPAPAAAPAAGYYQPYPPAPAAAPAAPAYGYDNYPTTQQTHQQPQQAAYGGARYPPYQEPAAEPAAAPAAPKIWQPPTPAEFQARQQTGTPHAHGGRTPDAPQPQPQPIRVMDPTAHAPVQPIRVMDPSSHAALHGGGSHVGTPVTPTVSMTRAATHGVVRAGKPSGGYGDAPSYPTFDMPPPAKPAPAPEPALPESPAPHRHRERPPVDSAPPTPQPAAPPREASRREEAPATPPPPKKSAPGDTSRVPAEYMPIVDTLKNLVTALTAAITNPADKRQLEGVHKKLLLLFQKLNDGEVAPNVAGGMLHLCQALRTADFEAAQTLNQQMTTAAFDDWMTGIKFLIQLARKLRRPGT